MAVKFNPFTAQLQIDQVGAGGGGGGAQYLDGEVATYADLFLDGTAAINSAWLVREASGTWLIGRKPAGIYVRTATGGTSRDADYTYAGILPDVFNDNNFLLYDNADSTKNLQFQLSGISSGTTRTLTVPNASGTIALTSDIPALGTGAGEAAEGNHTHGNLTNDGKIGSTAGLPVVTTTAGAVTTLALGTANQVLRVNSGATGVEFADPAAAGVTGAASSASDVLGVSGSDITGVDAGSADRLVFWDDSASKLTYAAVTGGTFDGTTLRWPVELVIACSDETTNLTTGTAKVTFRMPFAMTLTAVRASVNTAPTGSTLIVDINEGANSILSTKLSIDASEKTSTTAASAAVISDSALADDAEMTIDIDQIGSTIAGKGLKVVLIGTRA